ncbi:LacI family DNA-binding transcriptional regulator [Glaciihabitans arcticus]|uniref:LacI family DNA-binding transcriptional regulator n=1 Tax=Glaciihabitans arcticus TaxID=2668039 RepID=A0A4Q9GVC1_9MICO|nr:LacI family DNA-binding transcriptional regulator [Glaciihabitans arcticus]TBN58184.1 LacI family DNA-binding transcriptional regulator [Glaciihabitans arcticus]
MDDTASATPQRPNLAAVAALAGVSASTASLAFSGAGPVSAATRAKVFAAAEQLDYAGPDPRAQSLRRGRSGIVGVVMEDRLADAFSDPMNITMLDGIAEELGPHHAGLLLLTGSAEGPSSIHNAPVDAVILIGCSTRLLDAVNVFRQRGVPIVAVEAERMDGVLAIDLDNREGSHLLARHLEELGHTEVAIVALPLEPTHERGPLSAEREARSEGFTASERIAGVREVYPAATGAVASGSTIDEGFTAGLALLRGAPARPTAIIAQSDLLAVGVIRAALSLGLRVPEDLSVVGFDGIRLDGIAPHDLTTMVQPSLEKGRAAGRGVLALLDGDMVAPVQFTSEFHRGATTGPVPR